MTEDFLYWILYYIIKSEKEIKINHTFYKKPMATKFGTMRRAAVSENIKVSTAVAKFHRKWKNHTEVTPMEVMFNLQRLC